MPERKPLPVELDPELDALEEQMDQAIATRDAEALVQACEQTWKILPRPLLEWETQGLVGLCTNSLEEAELWDALRTWLPRYAEQYGDDDPSTRILAGVLAHNTGNQAEGEKILAEVLKEFGPTVFEGRKPYLRIARAAQ